MVQSQEPLLLSFQATVFTWGVTALGAATVFFFKRVNRTLMDCMMGFGAGVMIAASFFSLLSPAVAYCERLGLDPWIQPTVGFLLGGCIVLVCDQLLMRQYRGSSHMRRSILLASAVTLHNIPEGMVIGVAFAAAALASPVTYTPAIILTIGIGLQNFPEGAGISLPLRRDGIKRHNCFLIGQLSGLVEIPGALLGAALAILLEGILPFFLSLAAGAMITVVTSELIPESVNDNKYAATTGMIAGFSLMMVLDIALG